MEDPIARHDRIAQLAVQILHDLEIDLGARVGAMENSSSLLDCVAKTLEEFAPQSEECDCDCDCCKLGDH